MSSTARIGSAQSLTRESRSEIGAIGSTQWASTRANTDVADPYQGIQTGGQLQFRRIELVMMTSQVTQFFLRDHLMGYRIEVDLDK